MRKLFIICLSLININLFAQDWDEDRHEHKGRHEYKRDYFTVSLLTGSYIGNGQLVEANKYLNSISTELEYFKFSDLSLYVKGLYRFSKNPYSSFASDEEESHYKIVVGFGGRYYLNKRSQVRPYLQLGLNQQTEYINSSFWGGRYNYKYFMNIGVGFTVKLSNKFNFDMKYDINKSVEKGTTSFNGFNILTGIKYNL
jgi:hypothetical protein